MHSTITFSTLALALSSSVLAAPLEVRQDSVTLADTFLFIAKTVGTNPDPAVFPDINNWFLTPVHSGAGLSLMTLTEPVKSPFLNTSAPGWFRNGTDVDHGVGGYITAGNSKLGDIDVAWSLVEAMHKDASDTNPGATIGTLQFNIGTGTSGLDLSDDGRLITSRLLTDRFCASPNVPVEGSTAMGVVALGKYDSGIKDCWRIELYAQCTGPIQDSDIAAFPAFVQSPCYLNAASVIGIDY